MKMINTLKTLTAFIAALLAGSSVPGCTPAEKDGQPIHESGFTTPLPLQNGGEQIDVLVRVRDDKRPHQFNLIFVEPRNWPTERKDQLMRLYDGFKIGDPEKTPYPIKLQIRIDSIDSREEIHIDQIVSARSPLYFRYRDNDTVIWRAQRINASSLKPGIYRVRVDNLAPTPQIDFQTLFEFERDNRRY